MNFKKMWRKGLLLAVLAMALLTVCAAAEETGIYAEEEMEDIPVLVKYDPFGQALPDDVFLQDVESIPFVGTTYKETLEKAYPDAYEIYQAVDSFMSGNLKTVWMPYRDEADNIRNMLGYQIELEKTYTIDAICTGLAAYDNDHPFETCVLNRMIIPGGNYIGLGVFDLAGGTGIDHNLDATAVDDDIQVRRNMLKNAMDNFETKYEADSMYAADKTDAERYQYIHDYLCSKLHYNDDAAKPAAPDTPANMNAHNAFGALVGLGVDDGGYLFGKGNVVCQGYADAFLLLCQRVGLPCTVVIGTGNGGAHMWNAVPLDNKWYCLDVTWDDYEDTINTVDVSTNYYKYFLDNTDFLGEDANHVILGQSNYGGTSFLQAPDIEAGKYATGDLIPKEITLSLKPADGKDTAELKDALAIVTGYGLDSFSFSSIPVVTIILTSDATVSSTCSVSTGKEYWVMSNKDSIQYDLTRADGFTGPMFHVANNASLFLFDLNLRGNTGAVSPLITTEAAEYTGTLNRAEIYLSDVSVRGNDGACGMDVDAYLNIGGKCVIDQNYMGGKPQNLKLGTHSYICVGGTLEEGSVISVTAPENDYFAGPSKAGWTNDDRKAFKLDESDKTLIYEPEKDRLYCCATLSTDKEMPVSISYTYMPSVSTISGSSVALSNQTDDVQTVTLYAVMYGEKGKMLAVQKLGHVTLTARGSSAPIILPEAVSGTSAYKVIAVDNSAKPLAENVAYGASTGSL